jgi:hypothetical protein
MNGPEWLSSQLTSFSCPACRRLYQAGGIRLLAEREGLFFVDLDCATCSSRSVAIVTIGMDDAEAEIAEIPIIYEMPNEIEPRPAAATDRPVTADDVLEMHQFLDAFRGDVDQMFRAAARQAGGMDHR